MSAVAYTPGLGNAPFGLLNTNPEASEYAAISGYTPTESILIMKEIRRQIFDAAPEQYNALKLVFAKEAKGKNSDEFEYLETTFGRSALTANAIVAAVAAVPLVPAAQTLTFTAASMTHISPDLIILYPNNQKAVVKTIASATTVTVESQTSDSLPAVAVGDVFAIMSTIQADAMTYFSNYERPEVITRYNFIQLFARACRWGRVELLKYKNSGTTDFLTVDKEHKLKQIRTDLFNAFFNGQRGEFSISSNYIAKAMGGVFPTMQTAGSMNANPTIAGLRPAFETLAFKTNFKKEGAVRFIYGTDEMLYELSKVWKDPGMRYAPNDKIADLNLKEYVLGTGRYVPVNCELFRETSCFPKDWQRRLLVLDQESISPVKLNGLPMINMGSTLDRQENGTRESFKDWYVEANLSTEFNNPLGSFYIDVQ